MNGAVTDTLLLLGCVGSGAVGGVFFAFSSFVMPGLARLPEVQGSAAMRAVNVAAVRPAFLSVLMGTAVLDAVVVVLALLDVSASGSVPALLGGVLYLVGAVGVTAAANVPRNEALERSTADGAEADREWRAYLRGWTRWNHVRAVAGLGAAAALGAALIAR
ncbi:hypothetical protein AQ490_20670 [Wenjunlia vitaminophila]|uniref:DUF1772 domain-containing protein n=1 Tax=Wenjunlia vitaminophila TaxID=76728 RepID=A0A0T6LTR8_WENVI|nr:anthrone oxygenase family protein [Wenjunlia vitaminophila]KRV49501.1 hypothetical protein AQ490_20670 [Wenjunlia vitaminophila]